MKTIYKYDLQVGAGEFTTLLPKDAEILSVQTQYGNPKLWVIVDPDTGLHEERRIVVIGTGWGVPDGMGRSEYVGTYQTEDGFVWHVFADAA